MGRPAPVAPPTYPDGFPADVIERLERRTGRTFCCNRPYDGIGAIEDFGEHHLATGELILYTSQDSVLQVAAHVDVARRGRPAPRSAQRIRARWPASTRSAASSPGRSPAPTARSGARRAAATSRCRRRARPYLDALCDAGRRRSTASARSATCSPAAGISEHHPAPGNAEALATTSALLRRPRPRAGLHQPHRHRPGLRAPQGRRGLPRRAARRSTWPSSAGSRTCAAGDLLVLTADHGCRPGGPALRPHARARPAAGRRARARAPRRHDGAMADVGATVHRWLTGADAAGAVGRRLRLMPELPEVETIRGQLAPLVEGRRARAARDPRPALDARRWRPEAVVDAVEGRVVERLGRRGKYLAFELADDVFLLAAPADDRHAALRPAGRRALPARDLHAWARGDGHALRFCDPRRFGTGELALGTEARDAFFAARLGIEPLGGELTGPRLRGAGRGAPRARQVVPARPAAHRRRGQHLRRRGAVPRAHPPAAPRRRRCGPRSTRRWPRRCATR